MHINSKIDHTILRPDAKKEDVIRYCEEAIHYGFASVVVNSAYMPLLKTQLEGHPVNKVAVVGFPLGSILTQVKAFEAKECVRLGADEIDMVIHIGALKDHLFDYVEEDIKAVIEASKPALVKVIIETCLLTEEEIMMACEICIRAGADYIKTSTGFSTSGATKEHVSLMTFAAKGRAKIKASGGIRKLGDALVLIKAGADRLGIGDGKVVINTNLSKDDIY